MSGGLQLFVNGELADTSGCDVGQPLILFLRQRLQLTGAKNNCQGGCSGACTVLLSSWAQGKWKHRNISSCLIPLAALHQTNVTTAEGVGTEADPHPLQTRLADCHGVQCGYDTPGIIMTMYGLLVNRNRISLTDIQHQLVGNISRCTGYRPVLEAFSKFTQENNDQHRIALEAKLPQDIKKKDKEQKVFQGRQLTWHLVHNESQARSLHKKHPEAKILHGLSVGHFPSGFIIDVSQLDSGVTATKKGMEISSSTTLAELRDACAALEVKDKNKETQLMELSRVLSLMGTSQYLCSAAVGDALLTKIDLRSVLMAMDAQVLDHKGEKCKVLSLDNSRKASVGKTVSKLPFQDKIIKSVTIPWCSEDELLLVYRVPNGPEILPLNFSLAAKVSTAKSKAKNSSIVYAFGPGEEKKMVGAINISAESSEEVKMKTALGLLGSSGTEELLKNIMFKLMDDISSIDKTSASEMIMQRRETIAEIKSTQVDEFMSGASINDMQPLGKPIPHVAGVKCGTGEAVFLDDMPPLVNELFMALVVSEKAHAKILKVDPSPALGLKGVKRFISHKDVPNDLNVFELISLHDDMMFAEDKALYEGHPIGAIVATSEQLARRAAKLVKVEYEELKPIVSIDDAIAAKSFIPSKLEENIPEGMLTHSALVDFKIGDVSEALAKSDHVVEGEIETTRQEHFYEETYGTLIIPIGEDGEVKVYCPHPIALLLQLQVAKIMEVPSNRVTIHIKRVGCSYGGKATRGMGLTMATALAVKLTKQPVRCVLTREEDIRIMGQRGEFRAKYKIGIKDGKIMGVDHKLLKNAGWNSDASPDIVSLALFHIDNSYKFPSMDASGKVCKTHTPSNTAFRAYGAPPAMSITENMMFDAIAELDLDPVEFRRANFYKAGDVTHYGQVLKENDVTVDACFEECIKRSNYYQEKADIKVFNEKNKWKKRGICLIPNRYGIGTPPMYAQSGALLHIYMDGSIMLYIGGVECGQGLYTKMLQLASQMLEVPMTKIHMPESATDKTPIPTVTGGSSTADLCGNAVHNACEEMNKRLAPFKEAAPKGTWEQWIQMAFASRTCLSAVGHFALDSTLTDYNFEKKSGNRWAYFTTGATCTVVEIDVLTGEHKVLKTNIVMDVGKSLNPAIDITQIEGAFVQGYGYLSQENTSFDKDGHLLTSGADTYRIPTIADIPPEFNVALLRGRESKQVLYSSKGIGEPPFFNGSAVYFAIKDAVLAARKDAGFKGTCSLKTPASPANVRAACVSSPFK